MRKTSGDLVARRQYVVHPQSILARIARIRTGADPVVVAAHEASRRHRIGVEQCQAVLAQAISGNDVAGKRLSGRWIVDSDDAPEPEIARIEQLAEIALTHQRRRHCGGIRPGGAIPDPFLGPEEEHLVALLIERAKDNRTAQRAPELMHAEGRRLSE